MRSRYNNVSIPVKRNWDLGPAKEVKIRPDLLQVSTQGVKGGKITTSVKSQCILTVNKGFNEPTNHIIVDAYEGMGHSFKQAETAKIHIEFADGKQWNGTFEKLQVALQSMEAKTEVL